MAPKHDEIVRHKAGGWSVAWDATTAAPATRRAFDKVIAANARALRALLDDSPAAQRAEASGTRRER